MKIVFISNYFNHHQLSLSDELQTLLGKNNYTFIETEGMARERIDLGWHEISRSYLTKITGTNLDEIKRKIMNADILIAGSAPFSLVADRIKMNKPTFIYTERIFKKKIDYLKYPKWFFKFNKYRKNNVFLLCASAYAVHDYCLFLGKKTNSFKWGYFPEAKKYNDINSLIGKKCNNSILWVGRFINWKHAESAIRCAKYLKNKGVPFNLTLVGNGELKRKLNKMILKNNLEKFVSIADSMPPEEVRILMEQSSIFLLTSSRQEGWGAVLNEAMNSGCAVVASHAAGATPFLIRDGVNGEIYRYGKQSELNTIVEELLKNKTKQIKIGRNAYETIVDCWSPKIAAKHLFELSSAIISKNETFFYENGPCSQAIMIKDNWYRKDIK